MHKLFLPPTRSMLFYFIYFQKYAFSEYVPRLTILLKLHLAPQFLEYSLINHLGVIFV